MKAYLATTIIVLIAPVLCAGERPPFEYLKISTTPREFENNLKWIRDNVEEKGSDSVFDTAQHIQKSMTDLDQHVESKLYQMLNDLNQLSNPKSTSVCMSQGVKTYVEIVDLAFGGIESFVSLVSSNQTPENDRKLFNYLKHFGLEQYKRCLDQYSFHLKFGEAMNKINKDAETALGEIVAEDKWNPSQTELAKLAEKLDFISGKFKVYKMMDAMRKRLLQPKGYQETPETLAKFIHHLCDQIRPTIGQIYDGYNLARVLVPEAASKLSPSPRFHKLNDFSRLCLQLQNPSTRPAVVENITKNAQVHYLSL